MRRGNKKRQKLVPKGVKYWAIRRRKNPDEFEYLNNENMWGRREDRRRFNNREEVEKRVKAYTCVGVHARVVPYGSEK